MPREIHLTSLVVHAKPEAIAPVSATLKEMGAEVHMSNDAGKLVVTYETENGRELGDTVTRMQTIEGVLAATMVYHHCEPVEDDGSAPQEDPAREVSP